MECESYCLWFSASNLLCLRKSTFVDPYSEDEILTFEPFGGWNLAMEVIDGLFNGLWETQQCLVLTDCFNWLNESLNESSSKRELLMKPPDPNPAPFTFSCRYLHQTSNENEMTSSVEHPRLTPLLINIWILKILSIMPLWDVKLGTCFR